MPMTEAQKEWRKANCQAVNLYFNKEADADILQKLATVKAENRSLTDYIRQLVRRDIKNGE